MVLRYENTIAERKELGEGRCREGRRAESECWMEKSSKSLTWREAGEAALSVVRSLWVGAASEAGYGRRIGRHDGEYVDADFTVHQFQRFKTIPCQYE